MKRAGTLALTLLLLLTACSGGGTPEQTAVPTQGAEADGAAPAAPVSYPCVIPESASSHTLTLPGSLKVEAESQGAWRNEFLRDLTLTVYRGEEAVQTISAATGVWPEEFELRAVDADFDGDKDICFTYSEGAKSRFFAFYIWDGESGKFLPDPYDLGDVSNPTFDPEKGLVMGEAGDEASGESSIYRYEEGKLVFVRRLSYNTEVTPKIMWVTEVTQGDEWEPLRIVREGEFSDEDWDDLNMWRDLSYYGEE